MYRIHLQIQIALQKHLLKRDKIIQNNSPREYKYTIMSNLGKLLKEYIGNSAIINSPVCFLASSGIVQFTMKTSRAYIGPREDLGPMFCNKYMNIQVKQV